jgi:hypothetical protein
VTAITVLWLDSVTGTEGPLLLVATVSDDRSCCVMAVPANRLRPLTAEEDDSDENVRGGQQTVLWRGSGQQFASARLRAVTLLCVSPGTTAVPPPDRTLDGPNVAHRSVVVVTGGADGVVHTELLTLTTPRNGEQRIHSPPSGDSSSVSSSSSALRPSEEVKCSTRTVLRLQDVHSGHGCTAVAAHIDHGDGDEDAIRKGRLIVTSGGVGGRIVQHAVVLREASNAPLVTASDLSGGVSRPSEGNRLMISPFASCSLADQKKQRLRGVLVHPKGVWVSSSEPSVAHYPLPSSAAADAAAGPEKKWTLPNGAQPCTMATHCTKGNEVLIVGCTDGTVCACSFPAGMIDHDGQPLQHQQQSPTAGVAQRLTKLDAKVTHLEVRRLPRSFLAILAATAKGALCLIVFRLGDNEKKEAEGPPFGQEAAASVHVVVPCLGSMPLAIGLYPMKRSAQETEDSAIRVELLAVASRKDPHGLPSVVVCSTVLTIQTSEDVRQGTALSWQAHLGGSTEVTEAVGWVGAGSGLACSPVSLFDAVAEGPLFAAAGCDHRRTATATAAVRPTECTGTIGATTWTGERILLHVTREPSPLPLKVLWTALSPPWKGTSVLAYHTSTECCCAVVVHGTDVVVWSKSADSVWARLWQWEDIRAPRLVDAVVSVEPSSSCTSVRMAYSSNGTDVDVRFLSLDRSLVARPQLAPSVRTLIAQKAEGLDYNAVAVSRHKIKGTKSATVWVARGGETTNIVLSRVAHSDDEIDAVAPMGTVELCGGHRTNVLALTFLNHQLLASCGSNETLSVWFLGDVEKSGCEGRSSCSMGSCLIATTMPRTATHVGAFDAAQPRYLCIASTPLIHNTTNARKEHSAGETTTANSEAVRHEGYVLTVGSSSGDILMGVITCAGTSSSSSSSTGPRLVPALSALARVPLRGADDDDETIARLKPSPVFCIASGTTQSGLLLIAAGLGNGSVVFIQRSMPIIEHVATSTADSVRTCEVDQCAITSIAFVGEGRLTDQTYVLVGTDSGAVHLLHRIESTAPHRVFLLRVALTPIRSLSVLLPYSSTVSQPSIAKEKELELCRVVVGTDALLTVLRIGVLGEQGPLRSAAVLRRVPVDVRGVSGCSVLSTSSSSSWLGLVVGQGEQFVASSMDAI